MSAAGGRIVELDSLRAMGALGVAAFHLYPTATFWMSSFVWMFFVLSGFLITRMLLSAEESPATALRHFWIRRILRIWPVYYLTFVGLLLYTAASLAYARLPDGSYGGALQAAFFLQFFEYHWTPAPRIFAEDFVTFFGHSWTLAVEEQFYVVWPLLVLPLMRRPLALSLACAAALVLTICARHSGIPSFVLITTLDTFALGALLATVERAGLLPNWKTRPLPPWIKGLVVLVLLVALPLIGRCLYVGYAAPPDPGRMWDDISLVTAFAAVYGCAILIVVHLSGHPRLAFLRIPVIVYLGTISYSLYMYQYPIIQLYFAAVGLLGSSRTWLIDVLIWATVIAAASASYFLVERPLSRYKRRFRL